MNRIFAMLRNLPVRVAAAAFAMVAALAIAPASSLHAATINFSNPSCQSFTFTDLGGGTFSVSCSLPSVPICTLSASSTTPAINTPITLTATCSNSPFGWLWTGTAAPCSTGAQVCSDTQTTPGATTYTVFGGNAVGHGPVSSITVNWQAVSNPPTGCTVTRTSPPNGQLPTTGGAITLTGACTGGGAITSWEWRKNGAPAAGATAAYTETLPANTLSAAVTYSYDARACAGASCSPWTAPPTLVTVAGTAPVGFCSQFNQVKFIELSWGDPPVDTYGGVGLNSGDVIVGRLTVPAGATSPSDGPGLISIVEHVGPTAGRIMSLSTQPCDFRGWTPGLNFPPNDPTGASGPLSWAGGINPSRQFLLAGDSAGPATPLLTPGTVYYVNLQTVQFSTGTNSCTSFTCDVRITVNTPY